MNGVEELNCAGMRHNNGQKSGYSLLNTCVMPGTVVRFFNNLKNREKHPKLKGRVILSSSGVVGMIL